MKFDLDEIRHIAQLSRLSLSSKEEKRYAEQISSVLDYVKMIDEIDFSQAAKDLFPTPDYFSDHSIKPKIELDNVWRVDESKEWGRDEVDLALRQADLKEGYIKVKRVL